MIGCRIARISCAYLDSVKEVEISYKNGYVTKDEYAEALRSYQKYNDATRSPMRDEALVYEANLSLYFENSPR